MGGTGLQQFVYSSHQLCSVDETQVERVKTVKTCKRAQVYPQAGGFNWPQTTLPSVARGKLGTDQLQLPKPRAPAIKYGASTGVYCRGQSGNKPHPPNHPTVPMPISRTSKDEEALRTSYMALSIQSQENRAPKEKKKKKHFLCLRYHSYGPSGHPHNSHAIKSFWGAPDKHMHAHMYVFFKHFKVT